MTARLPRVLCLVPVVAFGLAGCGGSDAPGSEPNAERAFRDPISLGFPPVTSEPAYDPHAFRIRVAHDGCGVVRTGGEEDGLTWTVDDRHGFEVAGVNAIGSRRYRYYRPGHYAVVLTSFHHGGYRTVSNAVDIVCRPR